MAVESAADRRAFFATAEFGSVGRWSAAGTGSPIDVAGIFDNGYAGPNLGSLVGESREITFRCVADDLPAAQQGDTLTVAGVVYRVVSARPDGTGLLLLVLGT